MGGGLACVQMVLGQQGNERCRQSVPPFAARRSQCVLTQVQGGLTQSRNKWTQL